MPGVGSSGALNVAGRRVVVVGAARSGLAAAALLRRRGASVIVTDVKPALEGADALRADGIELELGGHRAETLRGASLVVVSPGVKLDQPAIAAARAAGVPVLGELEVASRWLSGRVIAITGTKGKSTTTTLVGRMLQEAGLRAVVGGNIGVPLSAQVDESTPETLHVVEASSFQLEATETFHPWIAAWLNFSPDHLDQHPTVEAYAAAKARVFRNQEADDWAVINADDPGLQRVLPPTRARRVLFGLDDVAEGYTVAGEYVVKRGAREERLLPIAAVHVLGRHLLSDVVAAVAVSHLAGADAGALTRAVDGFTGLEHAMEHVAEIDGVRFVNDSKATNVESARRSIESVPDRLVAIMGGRYKGGDFESLAGVLAGRALGVVAIGESAERIERALGPHVEVTRAAGMADAVRAAFQKAAPGGTVVLAPGCSSFDMFRDYAERGRVFKEEVRRLAEERRSST